MSGLRSTGQSLGPVLTSNPQGSLPSGVAHVTQVVLQLHGVFSGRLYWIRVLPGPSGCFGGEGDQVWRVFCREILRCSVYFQSQRVLTRFCTPC